MKRFLYLSLFFVFTAIVGINAQENTEYPRYTNLPTVYIETFDRVPITSKETYVYATMWYVNEEDVVTRYDSMQIRGRGNSTWKQISKKPYRIKFNKKERLLGNDYAKAKSWTLLANAGDKTLIRNAVTSAMGEFMGMDFCPAYKFVDLNLNGEYLGNYQISDQVEVRSKRVDICEQDYPLTEGSDITGGYLLEVDGFKEKNYFTTSKKVPIRIHYPDEDEISATQNEYIRSYIRNFETTLFSSSFADPSSGYRTWVDSTSLAQLIIGNEISANLDGYWSTYFYKELQDSCLYWGPLWDSDIAYSNDHRDANTVNELMTDAGFGETKVWFNRMWEDAWFANLINREYTRYMNEGVVDHMLATIDSISALLEESQQLNYEKWGINRKMYHEIVLYSSYEQYLNDLRNFVTNHTAYLTRAFAEKLPDRQEPLPEEPANIFVPEKYYYRIANAGTSTLLDVSEEGVCGWSNDATRMSQEWEIRQISGNYYHLTNRLDGMALNDPTEGEVGPTTNTGTQLNVAVPDTSDTRQLWIFTYQKASDKYNITNSYTQHTINLKGGNKDDGTWILSYTTDERNASSNNRLWSFLPGDELQEESDRISPTPEPDGYALVYSPELQTLRFISETPEQLVFTAHIYTAKGEPVADFESADTYSIAHAPAGVYIVSWRCGNHTRSVKFLKQ